MSNSAFTARRNKLELLGEKDTFDNVGAIACWEEIWVQYVWATGKLNFLSHIEHHLFPL